MPPEQNPLISVVIPTFNAARFLPEAIASIRDQLYEPLEIIVVDDGSTDETKCVAQQWPDVRFLHQPNLGPSAARNAGIQAARGDLLAFLDADDLWTPNHLRVLLPHLLLEPQLRFIWGTAHHVRLIENDDGTRIHEPQRDSVAIFLVGAGVYRRGVFEEVGLFNVEMRTGEDTDWLAMARHARVAQRQIPESVLIYRKREGSLTCGQETIVGLNVLAVLKRSIQRHRANPRAAECASGVAGARLKGKQL